MHSAKDPIAIAIKESLIEKLGATFDVRKILCMSPLGIEALVHAGDKGVVRAKVYNAKQKDFERFGEAWATHRHLLVEIDHPQLHQTYAMEPFGGTLALVGRPAPGLQLSTYCQLVGPLAPTFATRLLLKIIELYEILYQKGGHHLNLNLDNLYLDKNGDVHFTNYGLWNFEAEIADHWEIKELLDPHFSSPEHLSGKTLTVSSEIYQLGILYFKMLTGCFPFTGEYEEIRESHLTKTPPNPQNYRQDISVGHARILARALAKKPNERFWTLEDFKKTLSLLLPQEERHVFGEEEATPIQEADRLHYQEQLGKAKDQYAKGDVDAALHTVGAILMVAGNFAPAVELSKELRSKVNEGQIKKLWDDARYVLDMGQPDGALDPLHQILELDPNHAQTLQLQTQIFELLEKQPFGLGREIPVQQFMEQAGSAKTLGDYALAETLWFMVLLTPSPQESSYFELMQMQKKVARQELETLHALTDSGGRPVEKIPRAKNDPSNFRDDELEELFAPISPDLDEESLIAHDIDDALFEGLESALDESHVDLSPTVPHPREPMSGPPTAQMANLNLPEATRMMPLMGDLQAPEPPPAPTPPPKPVAPPPPAMAKPQKAPLPPTPPPAAPPVTPKAPPPEATVSGIQKPAQPKKGAPILIAVGVIGLLAIAGLGFFFLQRANKAKAYKVAASQALEEASRLEETGNWDQALAAWHQAAQDFPDYGDFPERAKTLEYKIKERQEDIQRYVDTARSYLTQGILYGNGTENAVAYLTQILALSPGHPDATTMFQEIGASEMAKARQLFSEEKVEEARAVYAQLLHANASFANPEFEEEVNTYLDKKVVGPQLEKISAAIQRKRWDQALELSEALRPSMRRPENLDALWRDAYTELETKLSEAEAKNNKPQMLAQVELMARIRPNDESLITKRNTLNREINLNKIQGLESEVEKALKSKNYRTAGRKAQELERLDSENGLAKSALDEVRNVYLRLARDHKNGNPRNAMEAYQSLVDIFNWKSYRDEMNALKGRIAEFDGQVAALRAGGKRSYDQLLANAVKVQEQFNDFAQDPDYSKIAEIKDSIISEKAKLTALIDWESAARDNVSKTYEEILNYIQQAGPFRHDYGKSQQTELASRYTQLIENYQGGVTLVIRSGKNLPKESSGINRAPEAFCELSVGGKKFETGVVNNEHNPTWDFSCNFTIQPGQPMNFSVYDSDRSKNELLGTISLPKLPKSTKGLVLSHKDGWSLTIDVRRER